MGTHAIFKFTDDYGSHAVFAIGSVNEVAAHPSFDDSSFF